MVNHPWFDFLKARLRLIHLWAKEGIPGTNGKKDAASICKHLNDHDVTQIRLLMATTVEHPNGQWPGIYKVMEECSELTTILAKLAAYPDGNHPSPDLPENLRKYVTEEMGDVIGAILWFAEHSNISDKDLIDRATVKMNLYNEWYRTGDGLSGI